METGWPLDIGGDTASVTGVPLEIAAHIGDLDDRPAGRDRPHPQHAHRV